MPDETMTRCETKRLYKVDGKKIWRWVEVAASDAVDQGKDDIRCLHCHGAIKFNKRGASAEVQVTHRLRQDADNCRGGRAAGRSSHPVE
jgi:hypothetical protein